MPDRPGDDRASGEVAYQL